MALRCVAVIPARGGSKGIPRKNVLPLGGLPLIAHTILAARQSRHVGRVVVSTDDDEISEVAVRYGAEVVRRPPELATDQASSESALLHALDVLGPTLDPATDLLAFLQCTSPLTTSEHIDGTIDALLSADADSAFTAASFHGFLWGEDAAGEAVPILHEKARRLRRQEREPQFIETGAVYVMRIEGFLAAKHRFFGHTVLHELPASTVLELDSLDDFARAQRVMAARGLPSQAPLPEPVSAVIMDFDGVFTDNRVFVDQHGTESVVCSRSDGMGLAALRMRGVPLLVLSKERNPVVAARCRKLELPCLQGIDDKRTALTAWLQEQGHDPKRAIYVGNDINDLECMALVGYPIAVADAHPSAKRAARRVLETAGGMGALRELAELLCPELRGPV